jgi:hypothetical protein
VAFEDDCHVGRLTFTHGTTEGSDGRGQCAIDTIGPIFTGLGRVDPTNQIQGIYE